MAAAVIRWASIGALYDPNLDRHRAPAPAPALVTGDVTDRRVSYEPLVGFTRLGNLLGLIERGGRSGV